ncbi:hypothetical protein [Microcystis aeruginosa]|uniref:hypothetical protein n=1 Tax=Microcystis aeruginosa TaxID=1126 RepID=UPI0031B622E6
MLDTGFTEFLAINKQDVEALNWAYFDQEEMLTVRGLANFNIYLNNGSQWLKEFDLMVRYRQE